MLTTLPYTAIFLYGIVIGSFLNVCIFRLPQHEDIIKLPSHCMKCGRRLKWYELIPVFSYLFQKGRCRGCREKISVQYPVIELLNGILYIICFIAYGFSIEAVIFSALSSVLIVIAVIDFRTYTIPLGCNIFILILGLIRVITDLPHASSYVIGFFAISAVLYFIWLISKGRAIGGGDIKLLAVSGLLIGWQNIILAFVLGCIFGSIIHITRMRLSAKRRKASTDASKSNSSALTDADDLPDDNIDQIGHTLAFGPYLAAGILISALYGDQLISLYLRAFM